MLKAYHLQTLYAESPLYALVNWIRYLSTWLDLLPALAVAQCQLVSSKLYSTKPYYLSIPDAGQAVLHVHVGYAVLFAGARVVGYLNLVGMRMPAAGWMMLTRPTTAKKKLHYSLEPWISMKKIHCWKLSMRDQPPDLQESPSALESLLRAESNQRRSKADVLLLRHPPTMAFCVIVPS